MDKFSKIDANTELYHQVSGLPISEFQRARSLVALGKAEAIVAAISWVSDAVGRVFGGQVPKPGYDGKLAT